MAPNAPSAPAASPSIDDWAGPSRLARALAVALAVAIAVVVFLVVNRVWRFAAPPAARPLPVEVQLVGKPAPAPASAARR